MSATSLSQRVRLYGIFALATLFVPLIFSILAVAALGHRGYAAVGLFLSLPLIQLVLSFRLLNASVAVKIAAALLTATVAYFSSLAAMEYGLVQLGLDHYGFFDLLLLYLVISIVMWEITHAIVSRLSA